MTGDEPAPDASWVAAAGPWTLGARARGDDRSSATPTTSRSASCSSASCAASGRETEFEGEVVGLVGAGAFVAFGPEATFEGMLPVRRMRGDWWELNEQGTMLIGTRTGRALRLGDPVRVRVGGIDAAARSRRPAARLGGGSVAMAKGRKRKAAAGDVATNRQASYRYNLLERFEAGIVLTGTEVKSLREGGAQLKDAYAIVRDGEVWLIGLYIAPYGPASRENHDPERPRKLLLHRSEIDRLIGRTRERGLTLVPTRIYFSGPRSRAKVEIALARGKDVYDKREAIRKRDTARDVQRELREARR